MKVLLIGATGNLGQRLVYALLTHGHSVVVYVRSPQRLAALLPASILSSLTVTEGDATNEDAMKDAILSNHCEAVINSAGLAAMAPWSQGSLPPVFRAVLDAVLQASKERRKALRVWFLGGLSVLCYPGTQTMLSNYVPIFLEHRANIKLLRALSSQELDWSMLCPSTMTAEKPEVQMPLKSAKGALIARATHPPQWHDSWLSHIPLLGKYLVVASNASRYETTLEQNADFIAGDLKESASQWIGHTVGVIDQSR